MLNATRDERLLMEANLARSPQEARALMRRMNCDRGVDVIKKLPPRRRGPSMWERFELLVMRWQGATEHPHTPRREPSRVRVVYKYR